MWKNQRPTRSEKRSGMSRSALIMGGLLWIAVFGGLAVVWQSRSETTQAASRQGTATSPIKPGDNKASYNVSFPAKKLPDFKFADCNGGTLSLEDLKGKRWVASFIFTSCAETCPIITRAVMQLHDQVETKAPDVMFVSYTVYPRVDTAEVLKNYSETFTKGNWDRWKFLTGSQQDLYELVVKGFGLYVKENVEALKRPGFEVAHSNRVVLVNEDGIPVGTFLGTKPEDMVKLRRILTGSDDFPQPGKSTSGLTFSSTDGTPIDVQFELQAAEGEDLKSTDDDTGSKPTEDDVDRDLSTGEPSSQDADGRASVKTPTAMEHNRSIDERMPAWARMLPTVNSGFNTLSAILLALGLMAIRNGRKQTHRNLMITAFITSAVFLVCYLTYHYALGKYTGEHGKKFPGDGIAAVVYQMILWPHIVLAVFVPFLAIRVFQHAFAERWDAHKKLAKITFPIWMFVSVTGVIIYGMLYHWP